MTIVVDWNISGIICYTLSIGLFITSIVLFNNQYGLLTCIGGITCLTIGMVLTIKDREQYQFIM